MNEENKKRYPISASIDFENNTFEDGISRITVAAIWRCNLEYKNVTAITYDGYAYNYNNDDIIEHVLYDLAKIARIRNRLGINVYIHNLSYDYAFIVSFLMREKYINVPKMSDVRKGENTFYIFQLEKGEVYFLTFYFDDIKIVFRCSFAMSRMSIEKEGKLLNIAKKGDKETEEKIKEEYKKIYTFKTRVPNFFKEYCLRDCEIAHKFRLQNYGEVYKTLANRAIESVKDRYGELTNKPFLNDIQNQEDFEEIWKFCNNTYRGGLNVLNKQECGKSHKGVYMYDVNSFFPYCMTLNLPLRIIDKEEYEKTNKANRMRILKLRISKITPIIPYFDFFCSVTKNGSVKDYITEDRYNEAHIAYYYDFEWNELQHYYKFEYNIIKTMYFYSENFLKDTIESIYKERIFYDELLQKDKNNKELEIKKENIKNILNSSYGKMAQNFFDCTKIYYDHELTQEELQEEEEKLGQEYRWEGKYDENNVLIKPKVTKTFGGLFTYYKKRIVYYKEDFSPIHIGGCITAYSRTIMMETIRKIGPKYVINGATDSLKIVGEHFPSELIHKNKLGFWKDETKKIDSKTYTALSKKFYVWLHNDGTFGYTCSGITKNKLSWIVRRNEQEEWKELEGEELYNFVCSNHEFIIKDAKLSKSKGIYGNFLVQTDIVKKW